MNSTDYSLAQLQRQEDQLQFDSFGSAAALDIGLKLVELARADGKAVAVEIRRNGMLLFAHGMDGTAPDHADWIRRKSNLVNRTGHSSCYMHARVKADGGEDHALVVRALQDYLGVNGAL